MDGSLYPFTEKLTLAGMISPLKLAGNFMRLVSLIWKITEEGKKEIYGVDPVTEPEKPATTYIDLSETVETEVSPPNRKKH